MKFLIAAMAIASVPLTGGVIESSRMPVGSKWVVHMDLDAIRASEPGKALLARIERDEGPRLKALKRITSLNPLQDLRSITLSGDGLPDHAVIMIDGEFDREHLLDLVKAAEGYSENQRNGLLVHSWLDHGIAQHASFLTPQLLAFSRQEESFSDTLTGRAQARAPLDWHLPEISDRPLIAATASLGEMTLPGDTSQIVRLISRLSFAVQQDSDGLSVRVAAECKDAAKAEVLRRMLDGVLAVVEIEHPELTELGLRSKVQSTPNAPGVLCVLSMPNAGWCQLMESRSAIKK